MARSDASIKKALAFQEDLKKRSEHCSADPQTLAAIGSELSQHVRVIRRDGDEYVAIYRERNSPRPTPVNVARIGSGGPASDLGPMMSSVPCSTRR